MPPSPKKYLSLHEGNFYHHDLKNQDHPDLTKIDLSPQKFPFPKIVITSLPSEKDFYIPPKQENSPNTPPPQYTSPCSIFFGGRGNSFPASPTRGRAIPLRGG
jgi:hypothetical protein